MIKIKNGVTPRLLIIAAALANISESLGVEYVITSGTDGKHMKGSKHYTGEALDVRTSSLDNDEIDDVIDALRVKLGRNYDVLFETNHIHIEYDKK